MSAAAVIIVRTKRVFAFLRERRALSAATAVPVGEVPYSEKWYFRRLVQHGAVRIEGDRCYLDESKAKLYLQSYRSRALLFTGLALLLFLLYLLVSNMT